jgi:hypothetical protein
MTPASSHSMIAGWPLGGWTTCEQSDVTSARQIAAESLSTSAWRSLRVLSPTGLRWIGP